MLSAINIASSVCESDLLDEQLPSSLSVQRFFALPSLVVLYDGVGGGKDVLRGAVVLLQLDDARRGNTSSNFEDVAQPSRRGSE